MTPKEAVAELRAEIPNLKRLAFPDIDDFALSAVLDFHDKAVAALRFYAAESNYEWDLHARNGRVTVSPVYTDQGEKADEVLAELDKEIG